MLRVRHIRHLGGPGDVTFSRCAFTGSPKNMTDADAINFAQDVCDRTRKGKDCASIPCVGVGPRDGRTWYVRPDGTIVDKAIADAPKATDWICPGKARPGGGNVTGSSAFSDYLNSITGWALTPYLALQFAALNWGADKIADYAGINPGDGSTTTISEDVVTKWADNNRCKHIVCQNAVTNETRDFYNCPPPELSTNTTVGPNGNKAAEDAKNTQASIIGGLGIAAGIILMIASAASRNKSEPT